MKKFVSVALVGAMALSMLVGCGAKEEARGHRGIRLRQQVPF